MEKRKISNLNREPSRKNDKDLVFGTRAIIEAIQAGKEIDKLLVQKGLQNDLIKELIGLAQQRGIPYSRVPEEKLHKITRKNHQGAICFISAIQFASLDNVINECYANAGSPLILVLDRVTDVRNFGAIARTAECAGVHAIVLPGKGSAQLGSDAIKTSAGALHHMPVCREENLKDALQFLLDSGIRIIACTEKTQESIFEQDFTGPIAILMGSEEDGISPEYLKMATHKAAIPLHGNIASLNVSVAAGVVLYEAVRQQKK